MNAEKMMEMMKELKTLNPKVRFATYTIGDLIQVIICDTESMRSLSFPKGYYFSPVYGLTNYGNAVEVVRLPIACSPGAFSVPA